MIKTFDEMLYDCFQAGMSHQHAIDMSRRPDSKPWDRYDVDDDEAFEQWQEEWRTFGVPMPVRVGL
jgi:hypothetical protein